MTAIATPLRRHIVYPSSDGMPMADNTIQFRWIAILMWNLEHQYANDPNVFVAGDHLIYPVEGDPTIRAAPDTYVAFGPKKKDRGSYMVWEEGGVFPQVVFEVWSPGNRTGIMEGRRRFYEKHGAEEYYIVYPEWPGFEGWLRRGDSFEPIEQMNGFVSPRLGMRFTADNLAVRLYGSDGQQFRHPSAIAGERDRVANELDRVADERDRLAAKLRELGVDPDA